MDWFCVFLLERMDKNMRMTGKNYKKPLLFTAALLPAAVIGGLFTGIYTFAGYTVEMKQQLLTQMGGYTQYLTVIVAQTIMYAAVCGFFGYILADKTGLLKPFILEKKKLAVSGIVTLVCGVVFGLDYWIFGTHIPEVADSCQNITYSNVIALVLYGGIIEEVMMRLFLMSLVAFSLWKLFYRALPREKIPVKVFIIANVIAALLFAVGH